MFRALAWLRRRLPRHWSPRRFSAFAVLLMFLATRVVLLLTAELGGHQALPRYRGDWERRPGDLYVGSAPVPFLQPLVRWDALYYAAIAREGYPEPRRTPIFHIAFFPLYPLGIRAVEHAVGDTFLAAILISNLCSLAAALILSGFGAPRCREGLVASALLLCSPGSHFLGLPYTEGLFSLLLVTAICSIRKGWPLAASGCGMLASATRSAGVVVALALLLDAWRHRTEPRSALVRVFCAFSALGGLVAFVVFCATRYGDPLAFSHVMGQWGRHFSVLGPLRAFLAFNVDPDTYVVALTVGAALFLTARELGLEQAVLPGFLYFFPLSTGLLKGFIRYQATNVPLMAASGRWLRGRALDWTLSFSLVLMLYEDFRYASGHANY